MTCAADEPLYGAPLGDRLGYLRHIIADLDVASPDTLHGAAHLAPLAGIELPMLQILADLNDAVIEAGPAADLDELARVRKLTRARLVAEGGRLAETADAPDARQPDEVVAQLRSRGEVMTAEIAVLGAPERLGPMIASRLRAGAAAAHLLASQHELLGLVAGHLEAGDHDAARVVMRPLLEAFGVGELEVG